MRNLYAKGGTACPGVHNSPVLSVKGTGEDGEEEVFQYAGFIRKSSNTRRFVWRRLLGGGYRGVLTEIEEIDLSDAPGTGTIEWPAFCVWAEREREWPALWREALRQAGLPVPAAISEET